MITVPDCKANLDLYMNIYVNLSILITKLKYTCGLLKSRTILKHFKVTAISSLEFGTIYLFPEIMSTNCRHKLSRKLTFILQVKYLHNQLLVAEQLE